MVHCYDGITEVCTIVQGCLPEICCNEDPPIPLTWQKTPLFKLLLYVHYTQCNTALWLKFLFRECDYPKFLTLSYLLLKIRYTVTSQNKKGNC